MRVARVREFAGAIAAKFSRQDAFVRVRRTSGLEKARDRNMRDASEISPPANR
jgi:hypothetical protein